MNYFNSFHTEKSLCFSMYFNILDSLKISKTGWFLVSACFCAKMVYFGHEEAKIIINRHFLLLLLEQRAFKSFPTLWLWAIFKDPLWRRGKAIKNRLDFLYKRELTLSLVIPTIKIRLQEKDMLCSKNTLVFNVMKISEGSNYINRSSRFHCW